MKVWGVSHRPPQRALERTEWNDICPVNWCWLWKTNRFSAARGNLFILEEEAQVRVLYPFFFSRRTEHTNRTGTNNILFVVDGHHQRWAWTHIADEHASCVVACEK